MTFLEAIDYLSKSNRFDLNSLLSLCIANISEVDYSKGETFPRSFYSSIEEEVESAKGLEQYLQQQISKCMLCPRNCTRTNVVLGEGKFNSKLFVVADYPSLIDDRTSRSLSSIIDIKSSKCGKCLNINQCFGDQEIQEPNISCSPSLSIETKKIGEIVKSNIKDNNPLYSILKELDIQRDSWKNYLTRYFENNSDLITKYSKHSDLYITSLVKCYSHELPTEDEINICKDWLHIERELNSAPYTLLLGNTCIEHILGKPHTLENSIDTIKDFTKKDKKWGKVICYHHPREILKTKEENEEKYKEMLEQLKERIQYAISN